MLSNCRAEVRRLVYEDTVARGRLTIATHPAYLTAVSENSRIMEAGKFGKTYKLSITAWVDIRESDTIVIENYSNSRKMNVTLKIVGAEEIAKKLQTF